MSEISFRHLHNVSTIGSGSVKFKVYAPYQLPQLATPQNVSASGTTVSWTAVENATSYEIFADGTSLATTANVSYNLTNSAGWSSLSDGNHNITIVAKADGYRDSEPSNPVSVQKAPQEYTDCITFTGESSDFTLKATNKEWDGTVEYSTDNNTWTTWNGTEVSSVDKKLYLRGSGNTKFKTNNGSKFILSSRAACSGNIQTLLEYSNPPTNIPASNCYSYMFSGCTNLTAAPELPATTLASNCYQYMFYGCTSLTQAPTLPATTLMPYCYSYMFYNCTSLTQAPTLPATTLANYCYTSMFTNCTNLTAAPTLPATTLTSNCYSSMFQNCSSLTTAPELPATTLANYCYNYMFNNCTNLTAAPTLPATTLKTSCYNGMFQNCRSLKISTTQSSEYPTAWRIPSSGTISSTATRWNVDMLKGTGGTFTSAPNINTTYYGTW